MSIDHDMTVRSEERVPGFSFSNRQRGVPRVFISSTREDLEQYRMKAGASATSASFLPVMMEYFTANGSRPPLAECLAKVSECDVLVVIIAHRYGWKPNGARGKSVTWLECEEAAKQGKELLAFLVDENCEWPTQLKDSYRIAVAADKGNATPQLLKEIQRDVVRLGELKKWLSSRGVRGTFSSPQELGHRVEVALRDWRSRHPEFSDQSGHSGLDHCNPQAYLEQLQEQCSWIDIRGLQVGTGKAHRFPINQLYIPLTMSAPKGGRRIDTPERKSVPLEEALAHSRLVVSGDPGSGKTTFLRHFALAAANTFIDTAGAEPLPILIRIPDLADHIRRSRELTWHWDSPNWLIQFLTSRSKEFNQGLTELFFRQRLENGSAILLLDGLDEAPGPNEREMVVRLFENAAIAWRKCKFVITTRPLSYQGTGVLSGFETAQIEPLESNAVEMFLERWCAALFPDSITMAKGHLQELSSALRSVPEIRRMARNPVMLTALAVVHWNERRLPEQRADLYESILIWLARSRARRPGRESAERCLSLLQQLALAMQTDPEGRRAQVEKGWAAKVLAQFFDGGTEAIRREAAIKFVETEEVDSGIVVSRGAAIRFWHLTFQEYLAARAIAGLVEADQQQILLDEDGIYRREWRELALLLGGVLGIRQGTGKVDGLFGAVLDRLAANASLAEKARCAGLLGALVNDLRPLGYQPRDSRYPQLMEAVLGIFEKDQSEGVAFEVRMEAADALGQAGDPRIWIDYWVRVEAGTLEAGEELGTLALNPFEIGRHPVTVAEYQRFINDDGYKDKRWWNAGGFGRWELPLGWEEQENHPNWPVVNVNWYEASAYCLWAGVRLPKDIEWEFAASGSEGREYPWGNEPPDATRANCVPAGPKHVTPIGLYPAGTTPEGIQDMAGNVWEWIADWYELEKTRVLRGGSWDFVASVLRSAVRFSGVPGYRSNGIGFRVARDTSAT